MGKALAGVSGLYGDTIKSMTGGLLGAKNIAPTMHSPITDAQVQASYGQANQATLDQQKFLEAVRAQGGLDKQTDVYNQLTGISNGAGPNPAQAMLANTTRNNIANQAALMASQRGSSANPALLARQAAQQGAQTQQQGIGQAAALQAQQQLAANQQRAQIASIMAEQQAQQQQAAFQNPFQMAQLGTGAVTGTNQFNAQQATAANAAQRGMLGSLFSTAGTVIGGLYGGPAGGAAGGTIGGMVSQNLGDNSGGSVGNAQPGQLHAAEGGAVDELPVKKSSYTVEYFMAEGGRVPALVSPGEKYLNPTAVKKVEKGASPTKVAETIPGKPKHPGNDYRNDTVPKTLDSGGIVIPNKVLQSKNPNKAAADFVAAVLAKDNNKLHKLKGK